jgi:exodeoxyribonuclease-3
MRRFLNQGYFDTFRLCNPETQEYSWWDYRRNGFGSNSGMRIDHLLMNAAGADLLSKSFICKEMRGWEKASDHVPVVSVLQK